MRVEVSKWATSKAAMDPAPHQQSVSWQLIVTAEEVEDFLTDPECNASELRNRLSPSGKDYQINGGATTLRACGLTDAAEQAESLREESRQSY